MAQIVLTDVLPSEVLSHVLIKLSLAHEIAAVAPTCKVVSVAVRNAFKVRPFSSEVVTLAGHTDDVKCVAAAHDGRIITGSHDGTVKVWRNGACERTIQAQTVSVPGDHEVHDDWVMALAVLPGGAHFVSCGGAVAKLLPGAAARRPALRQRLVRPHRPHRLPRAPRALIFTKPCDSIRSQASHTMRLLNLRAYAVRGGLRKWNGGMGEWSRREDPNVREWGEVREGE